LAKLWATASGKVLHTLKGHSYAVNAAAFLPGGEHVGTGSDDCSVRVWDVASGACARTLVTDGGFVNSICFDGSGAYVAAGCTNRTAKILSVAEQTGGQSVERTFTGHGMLVRPWPPRQLPARRARRGGRHRAGPRTVAVGG